MVEAWSCHRTGDRCLRPALLTPSAEAEQAGCASGPMPEGGDEGPAEG
jgi:hypothetical protein